MDTDSLDNKHKGRRGFIIGGGPSILKLQEEGFSFSQLDQEITVGVNKAYKLLTPTYLVFIDNSFHRKFKEEVEAVQCTKFFNGSCKYRDETTFPLEAFGDHKAKSTFLVPKSLYAPISLWNNSGVAAIRIAYLLGLNPIYLIGIDLTVQKNTSHFHTDYGIIGRHYPAHRYIKCFEDTIRLLKKEGLVIYSCSHISKLNKVIEYKDLTTLFL